MDREMQDGDIGTALKFTVRDYGAEGSPIVPLSSATTKNAIFQKPDGTTFLRNALFDTDGNDGCLKYTTASGDIQGAGQWKAQVKVITPEGEWSSDVIEFFVKSNLPTPT